MNTQNTLELNFIEQLKQECVDFNNIQFAVNKQKGFIYICWSMVFPKNQTYHNAFLSNQDSIYFANNFILKLAEKYQQFHIQTKTIAEVDFKHFDSYQPFLNEPPVKKEFQTDYFTVGSFLKLKFI